MKFFKSRFALDDDQRANALMSQAGCRARDFIDHLALFFGAGGREERILPDVSERAAKIVLKETR